MQRSRSINVMHAPGAGTQPGWLESTGREAGEEGWKVRLQLSHEGLTSASYPVVSGKRVKILKEESTSGDTGSKEIREEIPRVKQEVVSRIYTNFLQISKDKIIGK